VQAGAYSLQIAKTGYVTATAGGLAVNADVTGLSQASPRVDQWTTITGSTHPYDGAKSYMIVTAHVKVMHTMGNTLKLKPAEHSALKQFKEEVERRLGTGLEKILLFGSKARGDADDESDIDIMIVVCDSDTAMEDTIIDVAYEVNLCHDLYISPKVITRANLENPLWRATPFIQSIEREGVLL